MIRAAYLLCLFGLLLVFGCSSEPLSVELIAEAGVGPTGSLTVSGRCNAGDGLRLLVRARGGVEMGAQVEQAALTVVRDGRYLIDLGLFETLPYEITVILSPRFNEPGALSPSIPAVSDPALRIVEREKSWEVQRRVDVRLGTPEQAHKLLADHRRLLAEARHALKLAEAQLRELETQDDAQKAARWLRLFIERKRRTLLDGPGIDPLFPTAHDLLRQLDDALLKRYHAILAQLTGAVDERERLSASWTSVERLSGKFDAALAALAQKSAGSNQPAP